MIEAIGVFRPYECFSTAKKRNYFVTAKLCGVFLNIKKSTE